ncbi:MAG: hypothetical protein ACM4D3_01785 [Candidatus Sericytochromatia bacterium]
MTHTVDECVAVFNDGLPLDAPGCEDCGGSIRAVREQLDGVPVAVIDVRHSDAGCLTLADSLARFGGMTPLGGIKTLLVRHRFDGAAPPLNEAAISFFAASATA